VASGAEEIAGTPRTRLPHKSSPEKAGNTLMIIGYNTPLLITNWPKQCGF